MAEEQFLTPQEAADFLGLQPSTLAKWRSNHEQDLPYIKRYGRKVYYNLKDLQHFKERRTVAFG